MADALLAKYMYFWNCLKVIQSVYNVCGMLFKNIAFADGCVV